MRVHIKACKDPEFRPTIPTLSKDRRLSNCQELFIELMKQCWMADPNVRPAFKDIIQTIKESGLYLK